MAKYIYQTATGPVEIKVSKKWKKLLKKADKDEQTAERKHNRSDHKYAPGEPVSLECLLYEGKPLASPNDYIAAVELAVDFTNALKFLTKRQRKCFVKVRINERTQSDVAKEMDISRESVKLAVERTQKILRKKLS